MQTLIWVVHVLTALAIIGLVLIQHGKGADVGAAFGSGASGSLFGATGSANFLSHATAILAAVFFMTSLGLTWYSTHKHENAGIMSGHVAPATTAAPTTSAAPAAAGAASSATPTAPAASQQQIPE